MDISVILATYKRPQILFKTLERFTTLETEGLEWEVLVVDNAGDLETQKTVERFLCQLPLRFFVEKNPGKNNALNYGIKEARGDLFIFTDDDILADSSWLKEMWEGTRRWPEFSLFGGRVLPKFPPGKLPLSPEDSFFIQAYAVANWDIKEGPYEARRIWGSNMGVRAEIFHLGWLFNPHTGPKGGNYIMGSETEFSARLESAGYKAVYLPKSLVYHQILPEQLRAKWLYHRAFKAGRGHAHKKGLSDEPMFFGVPRDLLRQLIKVGMIRLLFFFDRKKALQSGIRYWRIRGMVYQYREKVFDKHR